MLNTISEALQELQAGRPVIVIDDEDRENEGDLIIPAEQATVEVINFMASQARGLICVPMEEDRLQKLELAPMVQDNTDPYKTDFCVSVNARFGVHTGISIPDRVKTIQALIADTTTPYDLVRPGHVFPLRAKPGGVLRRAGHTEATVDLARLAGFKPAGVTCEILNPDGSMARVSELEVFAQEHNLKMISIADLIAYRKRTERLVKKVSQASIPTAYGIWEMIVFESTVDDSQHVVIVKGQVAQQEDVLVRVHSECLTGDVFGSQRCDCGEQLHKAMQIINEAGQGVILYMRQEGRGIGLAKKLEAYNLQDQGLDTVEANIKLGFPADLRDYGIGAQMLVELGLTSIELLTNNPKKIVGIEGYGLTVSKQRSLQLPPNKHNLGYLQTKKKKLGHLLDV